MGETLEQMLLGLIYDYSVKEQYADDEFIKQLINIVVSKEQLQEYVKGYSIESYCKDTENIACYEEFTNKIIVYEDNMHKAIESMTKDQDLLSKIEQVFYKNVQIAQYVLHELEHARQKKIAYDGTLEGKLCWFDDINSVVLRTLISPGPFDFKERIEYYQSYYQYNYKYSPKERLAEINSYQKLLNALRKIKEYIPNLISLEDSYKLERMLLGYDLSTNITEILPSPTIRYLQGLGVDMNTFNWYDENSQKCFELSRKYYSFNDRLKYGLPINGFEYIECGKILMNTIKYRNFQN